MASNDIKFKVIATADGFDIVQKKQKGLADQIDKTNKSTKDLDKTQEKNYGRQKQGLIQTANGTKNFSKLSQTIGGGSSGLVGAYATLAANVFAASAAFNAFRQAAAFEQLVEGFTFMANESGRTTSVVVERLKEITGEALSTQEALQGASLALSAGFSSADLEGLAKVARGASLALGRNLNDAFDRLTRGAIKLEPEILDELGIMVRLDDATEAYANTLGKTANQLTQFQRQQAFLNAINEQGAKKYGAIADAIDVNPYDKLAAAFTDLSKAGLTAINTVLIPIANLFAGSSSVMIGGLILFGSTIITQMIPALGQMSQRAKDSASEARMLSEALVESTDESALAAQAEFMSRKGGLKSQKDFRKALKDGSATEKDFANQRRLSGNRTLKLNRELKKAESDLANNSTAANQQVVDSINAKIAAERQYLDMVNSPEAQQDAAGQLGDSKGREDRQDRVSTGLSSINQAGPIGGFKEANKQIKDFAKNADFTGVRTKVLGFSIGGVGKSAKIASVGVKFFGSALLNMIPFIGQVIFAFGLARSAFDFFKSRIDPSIKSLEMFNDVVEDLPNKLEQLAKKIAMLDSQGAIGIAIYSVSAGVLGELAGAAGATAAEIDRLTDAEVRRREATRTGSGVGANNASVFATDFEAIAAGYNKDAASTISDGVAEIFKNQGLENKTIRDSIVKAVSQFNEENMTRVSIGSDGALKGSAEDMAAALKIASTNVNAINGELISLKKQVADNERVFGKFFQAFEKKTKFDDTLSSFEGMAESIKFLNEETKQAEIMEILNGMGAQAKKFGLDAKNLEDSLPGLIEKFTLLQENAINLQETLKRLDAGIKIAKQFEKISVEGAALTLKLTRKRNDAEIEANNKRIEVLQELADNTKENKSLLAQITGIENENLIIKGKQLSEAEESLVIQQTKLEITLKDLKRQQQISNLSATTLATEAKFRAALTGSSQTQLQIFQQTIKAMKDQVALEKQVINLQHEKLILDLKRQRAAAFASALGKIFTETEMAVFTKTINNLNEQIRLEGVLKDAKIDSADAKTTGAITQGLISDDLFTTVAAYGELTSAEQKQAGTAAVAISAFKQMGKAIGELNSGFGDSIMLLTQMSTQILNFSDTVTSLTEVLGGEDSLFKGFEAGAAKALAVVQVVGTALSAFGAAQQGLAQSRVQEVDQQIAMEKKLDGKSRESVAKIAQMEAKKTAIQKKAFEQKKKIDIASAIISTALGAAVALSLGPLGIPIAAAMVALGMAQVNMIRKTTFQGGGDTVASPASEISVGGQRGNKVDVSQGASAGETAYLRGSSGVGQNANDFVPGGAMGRKGYAAGGMLVGERGPEVVTKEEIIPNYALGGDKSMNLTFNVSALDGASVQEVLTNNQGAVVGAIRDAANSYGQDFLPDVNVGYGGDG